MNIKDISCALMQLEDNEYGELILPIRKKLWLKLGEISVKNDIANKTIGLCKRVSLAKTCVEKVIKLWNVEFGDDNYLQILFENIERYMNSMISSEELENIKNDYYSIFERIAYDSKYERIGLIGLAGIYVANIALYDELLLQNTEDDDLDEDLDSFTWDASYLVSLVYSVCEDESDVVLRKREFWKWYLDIISEL